MDRKRRGVYIREDQSVEKRASTNAKWCLIYSFQDFLQNQPFFLGSRRFFKGFGLPFCPMKTIPVNTKHLYDICTMLDQRWVDVVHMLYKCFVFAGMHPQMFIVDDYFYILSISVNVTMCFTPPRCSLSDSLVFIQRYCRLFSKQLRRRVCGLLWRNYNQFVF